MLAAVVAWLGSKGLSLLLGAAVRMVVDIYNSHQAAAAQRDAGRSEVEAKQAEDGAAVEKKIAEKASEELSEDDAIARMKDANA